MTSRCRRLSKKRKITLGTKEWADYNVNCIDGCYNNCRYCYAKIMAKRFGRHTDDSWQNMRVRSDALRRVQRKRSGRIMFPSTHDIFEFEPFRRACFGILERLLVSGNDVLVTTKPNLRVIQEMTTKFEQYKGQMQFRFTITSDNNKLLEFWEENAPSFEERFASLKLAHERGFRTSVSVEPFLDYDPIGLVQKLLPFITESTWIGKMNYIPRNGLSRDERPNYVRIRLNYETANLREIHKSLIEFPTVRFKDSIVNQLLQESGSVEARAFKF